MDYLALEIFDLATKENPKPTTSQFAVLEDDATITVTDTSEVFASGDVWSHSFKLNIPANAHIFGTAGDMHGSRLHEQINKRRARLWVMGLPLYLGYLKLDDEADVDKDGNVDVSFESGQKTFDEMIEGINAREVSVGNVPIGIALNRRRVIWSAANVGAEYTLDGLAAYAAKYPSLNPIVNNTWDDIISDETTLTQYAQRYPKLVVSYGDVWNESGEKIEIDYTNVQSPYDASHPFCNINICYQMKANKDGEELTGRGYTIRLAHGEKTTHGGDEQTRYNNAPNFYLLYFIDRLFKDLGISIQKNEALDVEDIRRIFLLNYGCFYEELEDAYGDDGSILPQHTTPEDKLARYGQYYMPFIDQDNKYYLVKPLTELSGQYNPDNGNRRSCGGKILLRDVEIDINGQHLLSLGSLEGKTTWVYEKGLYQDKTTYNPVLWREPFEQANGAYSAYMAYATGDNYPNVEISNIIDAMKSMFGVRLLFNGDYSTVRIILLRNVFRNNEVQEIQCDIVDDDVKVENSKRGFRMTYGKGKDDTSFYYKGFADLFTRKATTWKDTTDKHDYSQWDLNAIYDEIKQYVSAFNKICYVTPVTGNAYGIKVDEDEEVLFPSLFEYAGFMDAEDGDCSALEEDGETIEEVQVGATPVIMNDVGATYASFFSGEMKAPTPLQDYNANTWTEIATFARLSNNSVDIVKEGSIEGTSYRITGKLDLYACERFGIRLEDNYAVSNGGTPFDEADPGLCFGVMRSSGSDATVRYADDPDDDENDTWDILPGKYAISHHDTCDDRGNEWDYDGESMVTETNVAQVFSEQFPDSNASLEDVATYGAGLFHIKTFFGEDLTLLMVNPGDGMHLTIFKREYLPYLSGHAKSRILELDAQGYYGYNHMVIEVGSSADRYQTLLDMAKLYKGQGTPFVIDDGGIGSRYGRISLKLRAEKLNPYYIASLPDIVRTKKEAAMAMTKLYTTSDTNLLTRPKVPNATMRAAGWDCPGDGYATVYSIGRSIRCSDGNVHEILWTPIKENGTVMTNESLTNYIGTFDGVAFTDIKSHDTYHMILDVDTTEARAEVLNQLQAIYYAEDGETEPAVDITTVNNRYLEITNENLRGRGLCDTFYKEYSYWVRNARIAKRTVRMELAQLLSLDKTKKVKVGDITGFIRKMQYSVSNKTGLGDVTMEIMYI